MSTLKTGALRGTSGTADSVQLHASDQSVTFPGAVTITGAVTANGGGVGKVLQIVANTQTGNFSNNVGSTHFWGPSEFETTITPSSASNKVLIQGHFCVDAAIAMGMGVQVQHTGGGGTLVTGANAAVAGQRKTVHSATKTTGERMVNLPLTFLDSPNTTSAITYKFWFNHTSGSARVLYINQSHEDTNHGEISRAVSTVLLTEIAG